MNPKENRIAAKKAKQRTFEGEPCKVCNQTKRFTANAHCYNCKRTKGKSEAELKLIAKSRKFHSEFGERTCRRIGIEWKGTQWYQRLVKHNEYSFRKHIESTMPVEWHKRKEFDIDHVNPLTNFITLYGATEECLKHANQLCNLRAQDVSLNRSKTNL